MNFYGIYRGLCTNNVDPGGGGRIKAIVPQVFGNSTTETNWCLPCRPPGWTSNEGIAGASLTQIPATGEQVWIAFEGGDVDYPVWMGVVK